LIKHRDQFIKFAEGREIDERKFRDSLKHLLDVVIRKDFRGYDNQQELRSIAKVKIIEVLNSDEMDTDCDPIPFLHRVGWQRIKNYLRDNDKEYETEQVEDWSEVPEACTVPDDGLTDEIDESVELPKNVDSDSLVNHLKGIKLFEEFMDDN
jgi:hypothetical protein